MEIKHGKKSSKTKITQHTGFKKLRKEWIEPILIALVLVVIIKIFIVQNFKIPSGSMEDTLLVGDRLFAVKFIYGAKIPFINHRIFKIRDPKPGDIIVFKFPEDPSLSYIKRCVAVGGQTLEIRDKKVYVDGELQKLSEHAKFIDRNILTKSLGERDNYGPIKVPEGNFFMMGDNRDNSRDSRYWGFLPYENLMGKALFIYWSTDPDVEIYDIFHKVRWRRIFNLIR